MTGEGFDRLVREFPPPAGTIWGLDPLTIRIEPFEVSSWSFADGPDVDTFECRIISIGELVVDRRRAANRTFTITDLSEA